MDVALLDTDMLSEVLKRRHPGVAENARNYLQAHGQFAISIFTQFEIVRGLKEKQAARQLARFETFCQHSSVLPLATNIFERAADLWVMARKSGHPHGDADLLIAATALEHQHALITGNLHHFAWVPGLICVDWRKPRSGT